MGLANFWVCGGIARLIVTAAILATTCTAAAQEEFAPGLCIIPVNDSAGVNVDAVLSYGGLAGRHSSARPNAPMGALQPLELPKPLLYKLGPSQAWTVSEDNTFKPYGGDLPNSRVFDEFIVEVPSGRILGTGTLARPSIYTLDPSSGQFYPIITAPYRADRGNGFLFRFIFTMARISRIDLTLIGTDNGVFRLSGDVAEPWAGATERQVGPIAEIEDLPVHGAIMLAGYHDASLRRDDGSVEKLIDTTGGWFSRSDAVTGVAESRRPGRIVAIGGLVDWEIEMHPRPAGGFTPGRSRLIPKHDSVQLVTRAGDYLLLKRQTLSGEYVLERLEPDGLRAAPGDTITGIFDPAWKRPILVESASLGLVLIRGPNRWYSYDGNRVAAIGGSDSNLTGESSLFPTDMPSIGKTLLASSRGLFEFTADSRLIPLARSNLRGNFQALADLPAAGMGLIATRDNLYALTRSGSVQPIRGATIDSYNFQPFVGIVAGRKAMLVQGRTRLHLVLQGPSCPAAQSPGVAAP